MKLNILGHQVPVVFEKGPIVLDGDDSRIMGYFDMYNSEIHVAKLPTKQEKSTVVHEIIEAINAMLELNMEHSQISAMETGLFQVFEANPRLLEYLKSGKK